MSGSLWTTLSTWVIVACWVVFGLVWLAGGVYNIWQGPRTRQRSMTGHWWIPGLLILWLFGRQVPDAVLRWSFLSSVWTRVVGLVVLLVATTFTMWARGVLGTMWSMFVEIKSDHQLRTGGPYAVTRHPIYTGVLGMLLGTALLSGLGVWVAVFLLCVVLFEVNIHGEERLMTKAFPVEYAQYRDRVPQLVPGAHLLRRR